MNFRVLVVLFSVSLVSRADDEHVHLKAETRSGVTLFDESITYLGRVDEDENDGFGVEWDKLKYIDLSYNGEDISVSTDPQEKEVNFGGAVIKITISEPAQRFVTVAKGDHVLFRDLVVEDSYKSNKGTQLRLSGGELFIYVFAGVISYIGGENWSKCEEKCNSLESCLAWKQSDDGTQTCHTYFKHETLAGVNREQIIYFQGKVSDLELSGGTVTMTQVRKDVPAAPADAPDDAPHFDVTVTITKESSEMPQPVLARAESHPVAQSEDPPSNL